MTGTCEEECLEVFRRVNSSVEFQRGVVSGRNGGRDFLCERDGSWKNWYFFQEGLDERLTLIV